MPERKRKYRVVPSEKAGYTPGLFVVQYHDPEARVWFDVGDPKPEAEARAQVRVLNEEKS